jgi:spore coat polysaccharide biosynthesis protein SpsF
MIAPERVSVIIQARVSSTRLPGKVLLPLAGQPALQRMVDRVRRVRRAARVVVATSTQASDDPIAALCQEIGIACTRGALDDVLGRLLSAVPAGTEAVVRLTGDCPLVDPALVDRHIERFEALPPGPRYVTNAVTRTFPDGLDVEVMCPDLLEEADRMATMPPDREHVTGWIQRHAPVTSITQTADLSALRWVLDTASDYVAIGGIFAALLPANPEFDSKDIYRLQLQRPDLIRTAGAVSAVEITERIGTLLREGSA